jgi:TonB family protein
MPPAAAGGDEAVQSAKTAASAFELKMRILEGMREKSAEPAKPVTSSYLKFMNFINFDSEEDLAAEKQIKKLYNLKDVSLLTEANLVWVKGKSEKAFHMFRLNGQEYLIMVTPGRLPERNHFRIEVYEQGRDKKANLLDTEFSLPDKSAAVFGFEDTQLKPYFITLRVARWLGEPTGAGGEKIDVPGGVVAGVLRGGGKVKPPKAIKTVDPIYPEEARKAGVEGVVIMEATTDLYGRVAGIKVLRSIPALDQAAVDALKQWVYEPMVVDGKPREVTFTVTIRFNLDGHKKPAGGGVQGGVQGGVSTGVGEGQIDVPGGVVGGVLSGGGKVMPPKLIKQVDPIYPEEARRARVEDVVIMEATTDIYGRVVGIKVLRGIPPLDQAAVAAVKQWVYEPMVVDGKPKGVTFTVAVRFTLDDNKKPEGEGVGGGVAGGVAGGVTGGVAGGVAGGVMSPEELQKYEGDAVRAVGEVKPPKLIKGLAPVYPQVARQAQVEGMVILEVKADEQGNVVEARVLRSIPILDQAAIDAVKQWKYEPLVVDGKTRKVIFTVTVRFMLKEGDRVKTLEKFAQGAIRAENDIKPPKLVKEVLPVYPEIARLAEVQGVVILGVKTDEEGQVKDVMVLRSIPLLDQAAIDAVRQWVYEPLVIDGKAVPVVFTVTVRFQLK